MEKSFALVVNEDPAVRSLIREILDERGIETLGTSHEVEGGELLRKRRVTLAVVDADAVRVEAMPMHDRDGSGSTPVWIALTGDEGAARARGLVEAGAFDVLVKPVDRATLGVAVLRALKQRSILDELRRLRDETGHREGTSGLLGQSEAMEKVRERVRRLAAGDEPVWFVGEEGSGREHAARALHAQSPRRERPLVVVPCAGLSEAEWAARWREGDGVLDRAKEGAILLKQLPRLTPAQHESLLRRLDRLPAASRPRVLASSSTDPRLAVEQGGMLDEVARRFGSQVVALPPLRERREDVALLARHFAGQICRINDLPQVEMAAAALETLERYSWPGNVRELRSVIEQALILVQGGVLHAHDLPDRVRALATGGADGAPKSPSSRSFREAKREVVEEFERAYLLDLLERHNGNVTAASQHAGMLRSALQRLLRKYTIRSAEFRRSRRPRPEGQSPDARP